MFKKDKDDESKGDDLIRYANLQRVEKNYLEAAEAFQYAGFYYRNALEKSNNSEAEERISTKCRNAYEDAGDDYFKLHRNSLRQPNKDVINIDIDYKSRAINNYNKALKISPGDEEIIEKLKSVKQTALVKPVLPSRKDRFNNISHHKTLLNNGDVLSKDGRKKLQKAKLITSENELPLKRELMLESNKSFREARDAFKKVWGLAKKSNDIDVQCEALVGIAKSFQAQNHDNIAEEYYKKACEISPVKYNKIAELTPRGDIEIPKDPLHLSLKSQEKNDSLPPPLPPRFRHS